MKLIPIVVVVSAAVAYLIYRPENIFTRLRIMTGFTSILPKEKATLRIGLLGA